MSFVAAVRCWSAMVLALPCLLVCSVPGRADDLADFHAAVDQAAVQYRAAMTTLETGGQEETAAAVHRFRRAWQAIIDRPGSNRLAASADDEQYAGMFTLVDARLVGALIVIDMGNREAAREALAPLEETLARLSARSVPALR